MNGRSLTGILADARRAFGDRPAVVITRNDDQIPVPEELLAIKAGEFKPDPGEYVLVANGGTSAQLVPVLLELERSHGAKYRVVDLQRDRIVELARSLVTEEDHLRAKDDVTESCGEVADVPEPERDDWTGSVPASLCG